MRTTLLLYMMILTFGGFSQQNDLTKSNLKGNVKSVRTIRYRAIQKKKKVKLGSVHPMTNFQVFYNTQGNDSVKCHFRFIDNKHVLVDSTFYEYGEYGKTKGLQYNSDGLYGHCTFIYNKNSKLETVKFYDLKDSLTQSWNYRYLDNEQFEITEKFEFESLSYSIHLYDSSGSRIKSDYYRNGKIWYTRKFITDKDRIETSWIYISNGLESEYQCIYEYDDNENWIKKTEISGGNALYVTTRTIEYY